MKESELKNVLNMLLAGNENECVEFKRAENNFDVDKLGKYFSAISNEAILKNKQYGWIIFGVDDKTHELSNTRFMPDNNFNYIKKQISDNTTDNISFIEIYPIIVNNKRVIMFQVPASPGMPINWKGFPYGRVGESLIPLDQSKIDHIKSIAAYDWSRQIVEGATIEHLDPEALKKARELFKEKHKGKPIEREIDEMSDSEFLEKARITYNGQITNTAMLLLGKEEYDNMFSRPSPRMTWRLFDDLQILDYEHFSIPYLLNIDKLIAKVRILRYRFIVDRHSLYPVEFDQYDSYTLRELIHNCIAH